ncbi:MAG: hypothetical protein MZV65_49290 [Chromatiales bacterium]|nr:hypothetical protein [Chromatiales bacterium]
MLEQILNDGDKNAASLCLGEYFLVAPRLGTISPWSSKATDIARALRSRAGVRRIERGVGRTVCESSATSLTSDVNGHRSPPARPHDRESCCGLRRPASALFSHADAAAAGICAAASRTGRCGAGEGGQPPSSDWPCRKMRLEYLRAALPRARARTRPTWS